MYKYIGIDIAKQTFDAYGISSGSKGSFEKFEQTTKDFKRLLKLYGKEKTYVMEATGPYYMRLASFLYENGIQVAVVNPLIIKRFSQMNLQRAKTDKADARTIYHYASSHGVKSWKPAGEEIIQMQQILTSLELLNKQLTATKNQLEAFKSSGIIDPQIVKSLKAMICKIKKERTNLEERLNQIIDVHFKETKEKLKSIPGIGKKGVAVLIAITNNFEKFAHYKQLIAYVGFSPRIYESGTSVKGKGHICKMGKSQVRKQMYMCAWSAKHHNKSCVELYSRLNAKGKPEKVIKVAIANKLLKQAFAVVNNDSFYDENFVSKPFAA